MLSVLGLSDVPLSVVESVDVEEELSVLLSVVVGSIHKESCHKLFDNSLK